MKTFIVTEKWWQIIFQWFQSGKRDSRGENTKKNKIKNTLSKEEAIENLSYYFIDV